MDRHLVGRELRLVLRSTALLDCRKALAPGRVGRPVQRVPRRRGQLLEHRAGVADDADVDALAAADLVRIDVDAHERRVRREARRLAVRVHVVEPRADHEHEVGFLERGRARVTEEEGMVFRNHAASLRRRVERDAGCFDESLQRGRCADHRMPLPVRTIGPLGGAQLRDDTFHDVLRGGAARRIALVGGARPLHLGVVDFAVQDVSRQDRDRPARACPTSRGGRRGRHIPECAPARERAPPTWSPAASRRPGRSPGTSRFRTRRSGSRRRARRPARNRSARWRDPWSG